MTRSIQRWKSKASTGKAFKCTAVNLALPTLHEGLLKITRTVPFRVILLRLYNALEPEWSGAKAYSIARAKVDSNYFLLLLFWWKQISKTITLCGENQHLNIYQLNFSYLDHTNWLIGVGFNVKLFFLWFHSDFNS